MFTDRSAENIEKSLPEEVVDDIRIYSILQAVGLGNSHPLGEPYRIAKKLMQEHGWPLHNSVESIRMYWNSASTKDINSIYQAKIVEACIDLELEPVKSMGKLEVNPSALSMNSDNQLQFNF